MRRMLLRLAGLLVSLLTAASPPQVRSSTLAADVMRHLGFLDRWRVCSERCSSRRRRCGILHLLRGSTPLPVRLAVPPVQSVANSSAICVAGGMVAGVRVRAGSIIRPCTAAASRALAATTHRAVCGVVRRTRRLPPAAFGAPSARCDRPTPPPQTPSCGDAMIGPPLHRVPIEPPHGLATLPAAEVDD